MTSWFNNLSYFLGQLLSWIPTKVIRHLFDDNPTSLDTVLIQGNPYQRQIVSQFAIKKLQSQ
jgi:hypothetical protein